MDDLDRLIQNIAAEEKQSKRKWLIIAVVLVMVSIIILLFAPLNNIPKQQSKHDYTITVDGMNRIIDYKQAHYYNNTIELFYNPQDNIELIAGYLPDRPADCYQPDGIGAEPEIICENLPSTFNLTLTLNIYTKTKEAVNVTIIRSQ
jgi:competence protein ComGC